MGDGFNFHHPGPLLVVRAGHRDRGREGGNDREVREFIAKSRVITRERLEERIRPIARTFPPYRAAEAEELINREIVDCLNDGDVRVKVRAWVDVCDPVREDLQKVWQQRLTVDADGDLKKAYVDLLTVFQAAWQHLLVTGLEDMGAVPEAQTGWLAPYALALAQDPKNAAEYLKGALDEAGGPHREAAQRPRRDGHGRADRGDRVRVPERLGPAPPADLPWRPRPRQERRGSEPRSGGTAVTEAPDRLARCRTALLIWAAGCSGGD